MQHLHKTCRELFSSLALDRWTTAWKLGSRLRFVLGELLRNDRMRDQIRGLALKHFWPDIIAGIKAHQDTVELQKNLDAEEMARAQIALIMVQGMPCAVAASGQKCNDQRDVEVVTDILLNGIATLGKPKDDELPSAENRDSHKARNC